MTRVKPPTMQSLVDPDVLSKVERACKLKAQIDALTAELDTAKDELIEHLSEHRKRISTPFGFIQLYSGRSSENLSEVGKLKIATLKAELKGSGDLQIIIGSPYITVSSTAAAEITT